MPVHHLTFFTICLQLKLFQKQIKTIAMQKRLLAYGCRLSQSLINNININNNKKQKENFFRDIQCSVGLMHNRQLLRRNQSKYKIFEFSQQRSKYSLKNYFDSNMLQMNTSRAQAFLNALRQKEDKIEIIFQSVFYILHIFCQLNYIRATFTLNGQTNLFYLYSIIHFNKNFLPFYRSQDFANIILFYYSMGCGDSSLANGEYIQDQPPRDDLNTFLNSIEAGASPSTANPNVLGQIHPLQNNQVIAQPKQQVKNGPSNNGAALQLVFGAYKESNQMNNSQMEHNKNKEQLQIEDNKENQISQSKKNIIQGKITSSDISKVPQEQICNQNKPNVDEKNTQNLPTINSQPQQQKKECTLENQTEQICQSTQEKKMTQNPASYRSATDSILIREEIKQNQNQLTNKLAEKIENSENNQENI